MIPLSLEKADASGLCSAWHRPCFNAFRWLRERSDRNSKPPAMPVEPKTLYIKNTFSIERSCSSSRPQSKRCFCMAKEQNLAHTKWLCKYHIVFTPKYRRKLIYGQYREEIGRILRQLCSYKGVEILEGHMMFDHVHMLVMIPPKYSVSLFMGYLKGKSSLMIFDRYAQLKHKFGNRRFWSIGITSAQ